MALSGVDFFGYLFPGWPVWLVTIILIWSLVWKGFALWKSSRKEQVWWFIALLLINTMGILEILYIFVFSEMGRRRPVRKKVARKSARRKR